MLLTCVIGCTGEGKSEVVKSIVKKSERVIAYDVQDEYELSYDMRANPHKFALNPRSHELEAFFDIIKHTEGYTFILEECTGYFRNGKLPKAFVKEILSKRHSRNNFILVFHMVLQTD